MLANKYLISVGAGLALGLSVQASASMLTDQYITSLLAVQDKALRKAGPLALDDIAHADPLGTSGASARKAPSGIDYRPGQTQASLTLTDPALVEALEGLVIALDRSETLAPSASLCGPPEEAGRGVGAGALASVLATLRRHSWSR